MPIFAIGITAIGIGAPSWIDHRKRRGRNISTQTRLEVESGNPIAIRSTPYMGSRYSFILLVVAVCIHTTFSRCCKGAVKSEIPSLADLDNQFVRARETIKSGRFSVKITRTDLVNTKDSFTVSIDDVIDGNKFLEIVDHGSTKDFRALAGDYFTYSQPSDRDGVRHALVWKEAKFVDRSKDEFHIYKPQRLMMIPLPYFAMSNAPVDTVIGSPLRRNIVIESALWQSTISAWKITCAIRGQPVTYWVVPERGYNIVRMDAATQAASPDLVASVTQYCTLSEVAEGIWFPKVTNLEYRIGNKLHYTEVAEVSITKLNETFPLSMFGPGEMELPIGTPIAHIPLPKSPEFLKWTGKEIAPMSLSEIAELRGKSPDQVSRHISGTYIGASFLFSALAIFLIWRNKAARRRAGAE